MSRQPELAYRSASPEPVEAWKLPPTGDVRKAGGLLRCSTVRRALWRPYSLVVWVRPCALAGLTLYNNNLYTDPQARTQQGSSHGKQDACFTRTDFRVSQGFLTWSSPTLPLQALHVGGRTIRLQRSTKRDTQLPLNDRRHTSLLPHMWKTSL